MSTRALKVLVVDDEEPITAAVSAVLRRRGHEVTTAASAEEALEREAPDVLVTDLALAGASGLELLSRLHERGAHPHTVFVTGRPTVEDCRRALLMGAAEFLTKPFRLEDLVRAVEAQPTQRAQSTQSSQSPHQAGRFTFDRVYPSSPRAIEVAARDVVAFALRCGICPSTRARLGSACAEIVDNARRHGYAHGRGQIHVQGDVCERDFVLCVIDQGVGFDGSIVGTECLQSTLHNGLARALALAEDMQIETAPGEGTKVTLRFSAFRVEFEEEGAVDLTELDFFTPDVARRVLHAVKKQETSSLFRFSPSLAVAVGRLLSGPDPRSSVEKALWS